MTRTISAVLLTVGILIALGGLAVGLIPHGAHCGSAFVPTSSYLCGADLVPWRIAAGGIIGAGLVLVVTGVVGLTLPERKA